MRSKFPTLFLAFCLLAAPAFATNTSNDGHDLSKLGASLASASLAVGPVPAKAGEALQLLLPAQAESLSLQLYTTDMRSLGQVEGRGLSRISFTQTSGLAAGVYIVRVVVAANCTQRVAIQKVIIK
jgi:hypothetical protein